MRLTLVCPYDPSPPEVDSAKAVVGGVERVFDEVSRRLAARGHDVTMLCTTPGQAGSSEQAGVRFQRVARRGTVLRDPVARLSRHLPLDSDVVHVAATYPMTTPSVLRRSHQLGLPSVLDFHFEPTMDGLVGKTALGLYRATSTSPYRLAHAVVVRSPSYARGAASLRRVSRDRLRFVPNGIDPKSFNAVGPRHTVPEGGYLLFVGRLVPYKGVGVLLRALEELRPDIPLLLVGDGPERASLERQAAHLGVDARFLGRVQDGDLPALYRGARLTLLPSVNCQEAFGISLLESMACGTPVVASDLPGVADVAHVGGLTVRPRDPDALALRIRQALERPLPHGAALSERVHARFSWDVVADQLLAVYRDVAGAGAGAEA